MTESNTDDKRLWLGNLDSRITEYQLLKILQKCGKIEKFDLLFHRLGPLFGQPRGYAFVTYKNSSDAENALTKLNGLLVGTKNMQVRLAKNVNYDEIDKPKPKVVIPALAAGGSHSSNTTSNQSKIQAIEAKLKMLESNKDDLVINKTVNNERPIIEKYQYNKNSQNEQRSSMKTPNNRRITKSYQNNSGPYKRKFK